MTVVAAIGAGSWGSNWVRTLAGMPAVDLRWVCDLVPAALERVRRHHPGVRTTFHSEELFEDPEVEAVVVATTARTHFELAREALLAGKHVLVEKPMTLTADDADELVRIAEEQGRILMVGHLLEYHPAILHIRDLIADGEVGDVQHFYSQRLNLGTVRTDENAWWSLAPHDISLACRFFGSRPRSVQCRGQCLLQSRIPDIVFAQLEFPGGKLAHMHVSWLDPHKTRRLTVVGSRKMVDFDDMQPANKVIVFDKGIRVQRDRMGEVTRTAARSGSIVMPKIEVAEPLAREARHFLDCVEQRRPPLSDGASGALVVSILEAGQRSLDQGGAVVRVPEIPRAVHMPA